MHTNNGKRSLKDMETKKISLILPFKERFHLLDNMIDSVKKNCKDRSSIEMILAVDNDDQQCAALKDTYEKKHEDISLKFLMCEPSEHFCRSYFNPAARAAQGRYVIVINDDSQFMTKNWDEIVYKKMSKACDEDGDDIHLGMIKDGIPRIGEDPLFPHFTCWVCVSKESINHLGYVYNEKFYMWGVDHFVGDVYKYIKRRVSLISVFIDHISLHTGKDADDKNRKKFSDIDSRHHFAYEPYHVKQEGDKLLEYIQEKKKLQAKNS